jgi:hypothetical protein
MTSPFPKQPPWSGSAVAGAAAGASIAVFILFSITVFFFIRYRRRSDFAGNGKGIHELSSGDSAAAEMDDEGRYWKKMMVRTVTDKRVELPAGMLTPVSENSGDGRRARPGALP